MHRRINLIAVLLSVIFFSSCGSGGGGSGSGGSGGGVNKTEKNPLLPYQWYYENTGQKVFSGEGGKNNKDLDVAAVHASGITGKGIRVMIVDDGLEMKHEDLRTEYQGSYNIRTKGNNPTPVYKHDAHGTSVGGIINMQDNFVGGLGIAPGTVLLGGNFLGADNKGTSLGSIRSEFFYMQGLTETPTSTQVGVSNIADIFNNSFGRKACSASKFDDFAYAVYKNAKDGRNGKGYIYVKSAGNGFIGYGTCKCTNANNAKVSCQNANADNVEASIPQFIVVGASNADGKISSYSSHGSNLWVSAPGGEHGLQGNRMIERPNGKANENVYIYRFPPNYYKPTMLTSDLTGCDMGYSHENSVSISDFNYYFESRFYSRVTNLFYVILASGSGFNLSELYKKIGPHPLNKNCNYNSRMNGTSAAAPSTSGVVALMLEANPNLTWRDVKHILAKNAINNSIDSGLEITPVTMTVNGSDITIDAGWIQNKAGYRFSNAYGFGIINAKKMVDTAKIYAAGTWGAMKSSVTDISPDGSHSNISKNSKVDSTADVTNDLFIEHVRIEVSIEHLDIGNVLLRLKSPQNTESILYWPKSGFSGSKDFDKFSMASNAFYGEQSKGIWTLSVIDASSDITTPDGKLKQWKLEINGH